MMWLIGTAIVLLSIAMGYSGLGGHFGALWQPFEFLIIGGAALGALFIANLSRTLKTAPRDFARLFKGPRYHNRARYLELLTLQYTFYKQIKMKGSLSIEAHVENPDQSPLFNQFPNFMQDIAIVTFFCDYLRMLTMGNQNPHEIGELLEVELESIKVQQLRFSDSLAHMAEGMPALGIVAAVLGVIHTMGSISEPPEVLGHLIGSALVGTFLGVLMSYGFIGPMAQGIRAAHVVDLRYFDCIKEGFVAFLSGAPPAIAVEFARKSILPEVRPSFQELEEATSNVTIEAQAA